jgi:hypothetical protein
VIDGISHGIPVARKAPSQVAAGVPISVTITVGLQPKPAFDAYRQIIAVEGT